MSDTININHLEIEMSIGAYPWEAEVKQTIVVDISLVCDTSVAGQSDQLGDALDYAEVAKEVVKIAQSRHYTLIESLAENIAGHLLRDNRVISTITEVTKPGAIPNSDSVSVRIVRPA